MGTATRSGGGPGGDCEEGLVPLENAGRPYHLIAHSHGGTVLWHALQDAVAAGRELKHLRTWTTLGTPFPTFRPTIGVWLKRLAVSFALVAVVVAALSGPARVGGRCPKRPW